MKKMAIGIVALVMLCGCESLLNPSPRCPDKLRCEKAEVCCPVGSPIQCGGHCYQSQAHALSDLCVIDIETCQPEPR